MVLPYRVGGHFIHAFEPEEKLATSLEIPSIDESASVARNTAMGGHLTQHIYGVAPPAGMSQQGKTLFTKQKDFESVWRQYKRMPWIVAHGVYGGEGAGTRAVNCGARQAQQEVALNRLGITMMDCYSCTGVDGSGMCNEKTMYMVEAIFFGFILRERTWILNTAFPVPRIN